MEILPAHRTDKRTCQAPPGDRNEVYGWQRRGGIGRETPEALQNWWRQLVQSHHTFPCLGRQSAISLRTGVSNQTTFDATGLRF